MGYQVGHTYAYTILTCYRIIMERECVICAAFSVILYCNDAIIINGSKLEVEMMPSYGLSPEFAFPLSLVIEEAVFCS